MKEVEHIKNRHKHYKNMDTEIFKELLSTLQKKDLKGIDVDEAIAYARMYFALYLLTGTTPSEEYGNGKIYLNKINELSSVLQELYKKQTSFSERARVLNCLYFLLHNTAFLYDIDKENEYMRLAIELCDEYMDAREKAQHDIEGKFNIMRLMFILLYGGIEEENEDSYFFMLSTYILKEVEEWEQHLNEASWTDLPLQKCLQRIELMDMNSYMLQDKRFDVNINETFKHYIGNMISDTVNPKQISSESIRNYALLYEVVSLSSCDYDNVRQNADSIANLLEYQLPYLSKGSKDFMLCQSIAFNNLCHNIIYAKNQNILED